MLHLWLGLCKWISSFLPSQLYLLLQRTWLVRFDDYFALFFSFFELSSKVGLNREREREIMVVTFRWCFCLVTTDARQGFIRALAPPQASGTSVDCSKCRALWNIQVLISFVDISSRLSEQSWSSDNLNSIIPCMKIDWKIICKRNTSNNYILFTWFVLWFA